MNKQLQLLVLLIMGWGITLSAQQLAPKSNYNEVAFMWNPAMTATYDYWEITALYQQEWLGFKDAPQAINIAGQFPVIDMNMSVGAFVNHDQAGALSSNSFGGTYAYKIPSLFSRNDQLTIGLLGTISEFHTDTRGAIVNDEADQLLVADVTTSSLTANAGVGLYYTSYRRHHLDRNFVFGGLAVNQLFPTNLQFDFNDGLNFKRALHANAMFGARIVQEQFFIQPSIWIDYASQNIYNANISVKLEQYDAFWLTAIYNTTRLFTLQAGCGLKGDWLKDGVMRLGTSGSYNLGTSGLYQGLSFAFYLAYRFEP